MSADLMTIRQMCDAFDVTPRTLRFYESRELLFPLRRGQHRLYGRTDRARLKLILRGKRIGFSLAECKELIDLYDPSSGNRKQLETFMAKIAARRAQLEQQLLDIQQMQLELDTAEERCLAALAATAAAVS